MDSKPRKKRLKKDTTNLLVPQPEGNQDDEDDNEEEEEEQEEESEGSAPGGSDGVNNPSQDFPLNRGSEDGVNNPSTQSTGSQNLAELPTHNHGVPPVATRDLKRRESTGEVKVDGKGILAEVTTIEPEESSSLSKED